jgi:hypothetical protein
MAVFKGWEANGCYKVKGVSYQDWDGYHDRSTRARLKSEVPTLLSEALDPDPLAPNNVPGAFGEGPRRPRRTRRPQDSKERRAAWWKRYREWAASLKTMRP